MRITTVTGLQLQLDTMTPLTNEQIHALLIHINDILVRESLIMEPNLSMTKDTKITVINPVVLPEN